MQQDIKSRGGLLMAQIWPIGGGKGGSGKSFLASALGRVLASHGKKTLLIDLDLGAANLHTMIEVPYPEKGFSDFLRKKISSLQDAVVRTPMENLFLISGANDNLDVANLPYEQKLKTMRAISRLDYDCILIDLGAGTSFNTLDFFMISQNGIFVATPEPTSIENIYRLVRAIYFRRIRHYYNAAEFKNLEEQSLLAFGSGASSKPELLMQTVKKIHPQKGFDLERDLDSFKFNLVLNQVRKQDNAEIGRQICRVIERHLGFHILFAGNVSYDDHVHDAICQRVSFLDRYPYTRTANDLRELGKQMMYPAGEQLQILYS